MSTNRLILLLAIILCAIGWRRHRPRRVPLGWRCEHCGKPGDSLDDFDDGSNTGYVPPVRRTFSREARLGYTRTPDWPDQDHES